MHVSGENVKIVHTMMVIVGRAASEITILFDSELGHAQSSDWSGINYNCCKLGPNPQTVEQHEMPLNKMTLCFRQ